MLQNLEQEASTAILIARGCFALSTFSGLHHFGFLNLTIQSKSGADAMRFTLSILLVLFFLSAPAVGCAASDAPGVGAAKDELRLVIETADGASHPFEIELAVTKEEQSLGLMYREELAENAGMLFDYSEEPKVIGMWMKNTLISLDMAFIDANGTIVRIAERTTPKSLSSIRSGQPVAGVLEVNGGRLSELGVKVGDRVRHPIFKTN